MILLIGGGIGGLAAATALRRDDLDVAVFEQAPEFAEIGTGLTLWKNAIDALDQLGIGDKIRSFSVPHSNLGLRTWQGKVLMDSSAELVGAFGEAGMVVLHRADLQNVLLDAVGRERVHPGKTCTGFDQDGSGVTAHFADGTTARGAALVGCDGLHSVVRATLHEQERPVYSGYTSWRSVVSFDHSALLPGESWGQGSRFGHMAMSAGRVYWFATKNAPEGERSPAGEKAELLQQFKGWHRPIEALIDAADDTAILRNDIYDRPVLDQWGDGRATLLGDAAHPMTPNLGQGACQALEDAVVLARYLSHEPNVEVALRAYEARRSSRTARLVSASRWAGIIGQLSYPAAVVLRNLLVKHVGAPLQARQLARIINYKF